MIPESEHRQRIQTIQRQLARRRLRALYLVSPTRILYTTGFAYIPTERPLAVVIPSEGPVFLMGPALEQDHVRLETGLIKEVFSYSDYPGKVHPIRQFARILSAKKLDRARLAIDSLAGAYGGFGYRGPSLDDVLRNAKFVDGRDIVDDMRLVKSSAELRLLKESAKWSSIAHDILLENTTAGSRDVLDGVRASHEGLKKMLRRLGATYRQLKVGLSPVVVGYRGQIGPGSAVPHSVFSQKKIERGDILVTEAGVEVGGYTAELERTVIVGKPSPKAEKYFSAMLESQSAALEAFRPGASCGEVDDAAREPIIRRGLERHLLHHSGHGIGLDGHEPPWLDPGDETRLRPGMVFSCEPGLYVPGYAGFRHSDTIAITKTGMSYITQYPRDMEDLTL